MAIAPKSRIDAREIPSAIKEMQTALASIEAADLAVINAVTPGTAAAGKAVVLTTNNVIDNIDVTSLEIGGTAITATAAELNRATDLSARVVGLAVTTPITEVAHEGRTILMTGAGGARTFTLPAATGGGGRYRFVVGEVNTSNYLIKAVVGTDLFEGSLLMVCDGGDTVEAFESGATDDTITLNGTTTGGAAVGDWLEFEDLSATGWFVRGVLTGTGDEVTPFSDTVT